MGDGPLRSKQPDCCDIAGVVSRRTVLRAIGGIGGCAAIAGIAGRAAASAKLPRDQVSYQPSPKGDKTCLLCANYEGNGSCKVVEGPISPDGWCRLWNAK